eukprot:8974589-Lingulodinium_polyedra.AAC.1
MGRSTAAWCGELWPRRGPNYCLGVSHWGCGFTPALAGGSTYGKQDSGRSYWVSRTRPFARRPVPAA